MGYPGAGWFAPFTRGGCIIDDMWYHGNNDEVIRHFAQQAGESAKVMGYDGVRFDGEFSCSRRQPPGPAL